MIIFIFRDKITWILNIGYNEYVVYIMEPVNNGVWLDHNQHQPSGFFYPKWNKYDGKQIYNWWILISKFYYLLLYILVFVYIYIWPFFHSKRYKLEQRVWGVRMSFLCKSNLNNNLEKS